MNVLELEEWILEVLELELKLKVQMLELMKLVLLPTLAQLMTEVW